MKGLSRHSLSFLGPAMKKGPVALLAMLLLLAYCLAPCSLTGQAPIRSAYAVTSAEKQAEVDEMMQNLDVLQTELNQIDSDYAAAIQVHEEATQNMLAAQQREQDAQTRISMLQGQLGARAEQIYKKGPVSYLEVIFGAASFSDFLTAVDMANRINSQDAELIAESKIAKSEAEAARTEYAAQEKKAIENESLIASLRQQKEIAFAEMQAQIEALKEEAAELLAQEELAAEAARLRAEEDARRNAGGGATVSPELSGRVGVLVYPCPGSIISSPFGMRNGTYHLGTDMAAPTGTPIYAASSGTVTASGPGGTMGNYVIVNHGNGVRTIYMHASELYVTAGESVYAGQVIAAVGSTGDSTGPHLHFQLEIFNTAVDPMLFL
jgi:murein DD-endopeptidase MepM/ murein hydrolase activator NlpD